MSSLGFQSLTNCAIPLLFGDRVPHVRTRGIAFSPACTTLRNMAGIFTPMAFVAVETTDAPRDLTVKIEFVLGRALDDSAAARNLVRETLCS